MRVDVVIVNWNSGRQLREAVASLAGSFGTAGPVGRVVVVDNGSTDGSAEGIDRPGLPVAVIRNASNRGFAAACNQGARESAADLLLFLNPDARLLPGSIEASVRFLADPSRRRVGIVGVRLVDERGATHRGCARFPTPRNVLHELTGLARLLPARFPGIHLAEWDHEESRRVDHVMGAFFLVRRELFEALGGFDERFFVYLEDLDFSLRAAGAGWATWYLAEASVFHRGGGASRQVLGERLCYALRSRIAYSMKHFSRGAALAIVAGTLVVEPVLRLARGTARLSPREIFATAKGYALLWRSLPALLRGAPRADGA